MPAAAGLPSCRARQADASTLWCAPPPQQSCVAPALPRASKQRLQEGLLRSEFTSAPVPQIDLTKSTRYYDPAALENMGVQYEKARPSRRACCAGGAALDSGRRDFQNHAAPALLSQTVKFLATRFFPRKQIPCEGHEGPPDAYAVYLFYMRVMRASAEMRADEEAREDLKKMPHKKPQTIVSALFSNPRHKGSGVPVVTTVRRAEWRFAIALAPRTASAEVAGVQAGGARGAGPAGAAPHEAHSRRALHARVQPHGGHAGPLRDALEPLAGPAALPPVVRELPPAWDLQAELRRRWVLSPPWTQTSARAHEQRRR